MCLQYNNKTFNLGGLEGSWKERPIVHFQIKLDKTFRNALNRTSVDLADNRLDEPAGFFFIQVRFPNLRPLHPGTQNLLLDLETHPS